MKVIKTNIDNYLENLKLLLSTTDVGWVLGGYMALQEIQKYQLLDTHLVQHLVNFDSRELSSGLTSTRLPLTSYNLIVFKGSEIKGQLILEINVSN